MAERIFQKQTIFGNSEI
ncbi:gp45 family putative tail fiber system protein, partial [Listeria monocytogenes]|nr:hypothetical protein [Listeria monocytogenes]